MNLTASLFGVADNNLPYFRGRTLRAEARDQSFYYSDLRAGLWYTRRARRISVAANGTSTLQTYPQIQIGNTTRSSHAGAVGITGTSRRGAFRAEQRLQYSPYYQFRVVPVPSGLTSGLADVAAPDAAFAVSGHGAYQHNTELGWTYQTTNRSSLSLDYRHENIDFAGAVPDWRIHDARVALSRNVARNAALVMGYRYHRRDLAGETAPVLRHDIDVGVNYNTALQFSPRTTFSFAIGSVVISNSRDVRAVSSQRNLIRLIGQTDLTHQLGRTWHLGVSADRGLQYVDGVSDVFFADRVVGSIGGYLGRRVDVQATTGYSTGGLRFSTTRRGYNTHASTARVRMAIAQSVAAQVEYVNYRFVFSDAVTLPTGIPARQNRQVFRVGLTTWFPLLP